MSKHLYRLFIGILLFSLIPLNVNAVNTENSDRNALLSLASSAFPEHAEKIQNNNSTSYSLARDSSCREIVVNETKEISNNRYITYTEYSDGIILLNECEFKYSTTVTDHQIGNGSTTITMNIRATCTGTYSCDGYFSLNNVQYTTYPSAYDIINRTGTASCVGKCSIYTRYSPVLTESANGRAYIKYRLNWQIGPTAYYSFMSDLTFYVGNNGAGVTHVEVT